MDETDGDGAVAPVAEPASNGAGFGLVERGQDLAAEAQALGDLFDQMQGHDTRRLDPEVGVAVAGGDALAGDLEDMPEAAGSNQAEGSEALFEQRIRGDCGA